MTDTSLSTIHIPGMTEHVLQPDATAGGGRLRYLAGGHGAPLVLLHTVRTQAEHFAPLIPLVTDRYTVYALDLPGMGHSEIVPGASYDEPAMRGAVTRLITELDLHDVTVLGESMGAVLALTTSADLPTRIRRVVAVNAYDYRGGIRRSSLLARFIITGVTAPGVGRFIARLEPRPIMQAILRGGLANPAALTDDYLDELLRSGQRPGYPTVARAVYRNLRSLIRARAQYAAVTAPVDLVYGQSDWSRTSDRAANQRALPTARFTEIPNAGHFVTLEQPQVLADLLADTAHPARSVERAGIDAGCVHRQQRLRVPIGRRGSHGGSDERRDDMADDYFMIVTAAADELEAIAATVERIMPITNAARASVLDVVGPAADDVGVIGSPDALDSQLLDEFGFGRLDAARRRIAAAVHDPIDDIERWLA